MHWKKSMSVNFMFALFSVANYKNFITRVSLNVKLLMSVVK